MVDVVNATVNKNGMTDDEKAKHDADMAAVANAQVTSITSTDSRNPEGDRSLTQQAGDGDDTNVTARPDDIPEKFWDAEKGEVNVTALLKAQQDGEAALRQTQAKPDDKSDDKPDDNASDGDDSGNKPDDKSDDKPDDKPDDADQTNVVATASAEFAKDGQLSDETYTNLAKVGLSRDYVDNYIAGQQALVTTMETAVYGPFDGAKEGYETAANWAAENMSEQEIQALDIQIQSPNPAIAGEGAKALAAAYAANADRDPTVTLTGDSNAGPSGSHYQSSAEMQKDMSSKQYATDEAFRAEVQRKIARADAAGVNLFG